MNARVRNETRELTEDEVGEVAGGNPGFGAGVLTGAVAMGAAAIVTVLIVTNSDAVTQSIGDLAQKTLEQQKKPQPQ